MPTERTEKAACMTVGFLLGVLAVFAVLANARSWPFSPRLIGVVAACPEHYTCVYRDGELRAHKYATDMRYSNGRWEEE